MNQIDHLLQSVVAKYPNKIALKDVLNELTYKELSSNIDAFTEEHQLDSSESLEFGLLMEPSLEYLIAFISILSAGHRVVPINTELPVKRIEQLIEAASFDAIFIQYPESLSFEIPSGLKIYSLTVNDKRITSKVYSEGGNYLPKKTYTTRSAYTIFTSGTTGKPKGICGSEHGLLHFIQWEIERFQLNGMNVAMLTNIGFDVSFREILVPLLSGGTLSIPDKKTVKNPVALLNWMEQEKIQVIHYIPALLRVLANTANEGQLDALLFVFSAGEALFWNDVAIMREKMKNAGIINLYGPSETTLAKIYFEIPNTNHENSGIVPLGIPLDEEVVVFISNDGENPVPDGEKGELIISTRYASNGYLNDHELNAQKFKKIITPDGATITQFNTGDLGMKKDGIFHYLGRMDHQCKVDGNRVELLEIESILRSLSFVEDGAVIIDDQDGRSNVIIGFVVPTKEVSSEEVLEALREQLPEYSLPKQVAFIEAIPLNQNGKLDRKALSEEWNKRKLQRQDSFSENEPITDVNEPLESGILAIITNILGNERILQDKTFIELGGSSLNAIQLIAAVYKVHNVLLEVPFILGKPVREVIQFVINMMRPQEEPKTESTIEEFDLSPFQEQLLYMSNFSTDANVAYNVFEAYKVQTELDVERLKSTIITTIEAHTIFRTVYGIEEGNVKQRIRKMDEEQLISVKTGLSEEEINENFKQIALTPFDLESDNLLIQFYIQSTNDFTFYLAFKVHHIAVDAWALQNLRNQIIDGYLEGNSQKKEVTQYQSFVSTYQEYLVSERFKTDADYWLNQFYRKSLFYSPTEFTRPATLGFKGRIETIALGTELSRSYLQLAKDHGMTTFMLFNAIVSIPLSHYSNTSEVVMGTPVSLRDIRGDLNDSMGYFLNMLPIRIEVDKELTAKKQFQNTAQLMLDNYEHKLYPFQQLVNQLDEEFQANHNPLFDIMIVELDYVANESESESNISLFGTNDFSSKFDLTIGLIKRGAELSISLEYNLDLYSSDGAKNILTDLQHTIKEVIKNPEATIQGISDKYRFVATNDAPIYKETFSNVSNTISINDDVNDFISKLLNEMIEGFNPEKNFFEEGLTSTQSLILITKINKEFDTVIKIIDLWNHHYQNDLIAHVSSQLIVKKIAQ